MNEYKGHPSISTNEYKVAGRNLDLVIDNFEDTICTAKCAVEVKELHENVKCPHCGKSYYMENYSVSTAVYYPPIYKDGVNINPDRNQSTTHCTCMNCGREFDY